MVQETQNGSHFEMGNMRTSAEANASKDRKRGIGRPKGSKDKNPRRKAGASRSKDWAEQGKTLKDVTSTTTTSSSSSSKGRKDDQNLQKKVHKVQPSATGMTATTSSVARATRDAAAPVNAPWGGGRGGGGGGGISLPMPTALRALPTPLPLPPGARKDAPSQTFKREDEQCKQRRERESACEEREREEGERRRQRMQNLKPLPLPPSSSSSNIQDDPPQEQCTAGPGESSGVLGKANGMLQLDVRGCECAQEFEQGEFLERHRLMSPEGVVGVAIQQALEVRLNDLLGKRGSCTVSVTSANEEQRYVMPSLSPWKGDEGVSCVQAVLQVKISNADERRLAQMLNTLADSTGDEARALGFALAQRLADLLPSFTDSTTSALKTLLLSLKRAYIYGTAARYNESPDQVQVDYEMKDRTCARVTVRIRAPPPACPVCSQPVIELKGITSSTPTASMNPRPQPSLMSRPGTITPPHTSSKLNAASTSPKTASTKRAEQMVSPNKRNIPLKDKDIAHPNVSASACIAQEGESPLPLGWTRHWGKSKRQFYYFHALTRTTTWDRPGLVPAATQAVPEVKSAFKDNPGMGIVAREEGLFVEQGVDTCTQAKDAGTSQGVCLGGEGERGADKCPQAHDSASAPRHHTVTSLFSIPPPPPLASLPPPPLPLAAARASSNVILHRNTPCKSIHATLPLSLSPSLHTHTICVHDICIGCRTLLSVVRNDRNDRS
jgi:hypothetical protein